MFQFVIASASEAIQRREETGFVALLPATTRNCEGNTNVLRGWVYRRGAEEKSCRLPPHGEEGRQGLARAWRAGLPGMGGRGRQGRKAHLVSAQRQAQAGRDGGVLLDHLQIAGAARPRQRLGDGGQTAYRHDGHKVPAVRRQAHDLWRVRESREGVKGLRPQRRARSARLRWRGRWRRSGPG